MFKMLLNGLFTFSLYGIYYAFSKCVHIYSEGFFGTFISLLHCPSNSGHF